MPTGSRYVSIDNVLNSEQLNTGTSNGIVDHHTARSHSWTPGADGEYSNSFRSHSSSSSTHLIQCPSCKGLGKVPKEFEDELVALIPMSDRRLKPRRTCMYVILAITGCSIIAGLLVFFLLPRELDITSTNPYLLPSEVIINTTFPSVTFTVTNMFNATNSNFYGVTITGVTLKARYFSTSIVGSSTAYTDGLSMSLRSTQTFQVPITIKLNQQFGNSSVRRCQSPIEWEHDLYFHFDVSVNISGLGSKSQSLFSTFQRASCFPPIPPVTVTSPVTAPAEPIFQLVTTRV